MNPARVLVTGASGLVGRAICAELTAHGVEVVALRNRRDPPDVSAVLQYDGMDRAAFGSALRGIEAVVHAAARFEGDDLHAVNVDFTESLVDAANAARMSRFVFLSSAMVYAPGFYSLADESHPVAPQEPYGRSKLAAEQIVFEKFRGSSTSLRPSSIYGDREGRIVDFARVMLDLPELPRSEVPIDLVHARDVAAAVALALRSTTISPAYNVTGPSSAPFSALARAAASAMGRDIALVEPAHLGDRIPDALKEAATVERTIDCGRAKRDLGYVPEFDWSESFARACRAGS